MSIVQITRELIDSLTRKTVPPDIKNESDLERLFVLPVAKGLLAQHPDVLLYAHPFGGKRCCAPACEHLPPATSGRIIGCPKCWKASKSWASPAAFGTHHSFDLVARDEKDTLAIELKFSKARGGKMPNGEVQRFLGQCALAAAKHSEVLGLFVHQGHLDNRWHSDTEAVDAWFGQQNVHLVFRAT